MEVNSPENLLASSRVGVSPETFSLVSLTRESWLKLLENPELSPRMTAPFMILFDRHEVTMLLDDVDAALLRNGSPGIRMEGGWRLLTFDQVMDFTFVGFIARVSGILADAGIPIIPLSAFSRDHILIKQADLANALRALGPHVADLC